MSFIEWDEKYSINNSKIDEQHKRLFALCNKVYDAIAENKDKIILNEVFIELLEYTRYHFNSEEEYMKSINYPNLEQHIVEHKNLVNEVENLFEKLEISRDNMAQDVLSFLVGWLFNHIMDQDKKITAN